MPKGFNPTRKVANQGVAFVQRIVDEMDSVWRPTPNDDVGFDGEIELGKEGLATGRLIKVQVKSGKSYIHNPHGQSFEFIAKEEDIEYWSSANVPVILIVYDPELNEGYWKSIQQTVANAPPAKGSSYRIPFHRKRDRFVTGSFLQVCNLVFPDEAELTRFLKDKITEPIYSNLLSVLEYPEMLFQFQISETRLSERDSDDMSFPDDYVSHGNGYIGFRDPRLPGSGLRGALLADSVEAEKTLEYLQNPQARSKIVGLWNYSLGTYLLSLGLKQRAKNRVYFPPADGNVAREIQWTSPHRTPTRSVAYPYTGKKSQQVMFWVHHSINANFREVGGDWFLKLIPGYVFTRDGQHFIQSSDAGALSTSRMSQERNYQVINHLYFWAWFLNNGNSEIRIPCGSQSIVIAPNLAGGIANFGLGTDKKTLTAILKADYDVDWSDLEESSTEASDPEAE